MRSAVNTPIVNTGEITAHIYYYIGLTAGQIFLVFAVENARLSLRRGRADIIIIYVHV